MVIWNFHIKELVPKLKGLIMHTNQHTYPPHGSYAACNTYKVDLDHIYFTYNYNGLYITVYDIQHNHEVSYTRAYAIPKHTLQDLRDYLNFEKKRAKL